MRRPRPQAKIDRTWLVWFDGAVCQLRRPHRHRGLVVDAIHYDESKRWTTQRREDAIRGIKILRKPTPPKRGSLQLATDDPSAFSGFPNIRAFLLDQTYGQDDERRSPGLIMFSGSDDGWRFTLKDPTACVMLKVTCRTFDGAILIIEELLGKEDCPWETDPYEVNKRAQSRGKGGRQYGK